jgi:uncharacterized membrane protein YoaK (UPF0700 family)
MPLFRRTQNRVRIPRINVLLVALAAASGWLDATMFLRLHVFAANMTGNTVLFALGLAGGQIGAAGLSVAALAAFVMGSFCGTALGKSAHAPGRASRNILGLEVVLLALVPVLWLFPAGAALPRTVLVAIASFAMGMQQTATEQLHPAPSTSTTFMSGTTERIGSGFYSLLSGAPNAFALNAIVWLAFFGAAFAAGSLAGTIGVALAAVPFCVVAGVLTAQRQHAV